MHISLTGSVLQREFHWEFLGILMPLPVPIRPSSSANAGDQGDQGTCQRLLGETTFRHQNARTANVTTRRTMAVKEIHERRCGNELIRLAYTLAR